MDTIVNWNGLPCLHDRVSGKSAIFTNIGGELTICRVDTCKLNDISVFNQMEAAGGFKCIDKNEEGSLHEFTLVLSVTEKCNAKCKYCFLDAQDDGEDMDIDLIEKSIDLAISLSKGRMINFAAFGGEPSLRADLVRHMVDYAKMRCSDIGIDNNKIKFSITTNGYFNDSFCDFLINNRFNVSFSMDGIPMVQNEQRPCAMNLSQLEKNLTRLANSICILKVRSTVTEYSAQYMLESAKYLHGLGVKRIHYEPVTPGGRAGNNEGAIRQPDVTVFSDNLIGCIQYGETKGMDIICFPYMNINNAPIAFCDGSIKNRIVVGPHGVLSTCVEVQDETHPLYDYLGVGHYDDDKKEFIFDYDTRRICHDCSLNKKHLECETCAYAFFCAGGCPTRNYRGTQNSDTISEFRCGIMKRVMPFVLRRFYDKTFHRIESIV